MVATESEPVAGRRRSAISAVFRENRLRIHAAYALFLAENLIELATPAVLGFAVVGLLRADAVGVVWLAGQQLGLALVGVVRRAVDTRVYVRIYARLAARRVIAQREAGVPASAVVARAALARQLVDFWERDVPFLAHFTFRVVGSVAWLAAAAPVLLLVCLGAGAVSVLGSAWYARRAAVLNRCLHDRLEREAGIILDADLDEVREHYAEQARVRVRLSDAEAWVFGGWQVVGIAVLATALVAICRPGTDLATATATAGYVVLFLTALTNTPLLAEQVTRVRDVARRLGEDSDRWVVDRSRGIG